MKSKAMVGCLITAYVKEDIKHHISSLAFDRVKTGLNIMGSRAGNKGATAIRFKYKHNSLIFVNTHLASG